MIKRPLTAGEYVWFVLLTCAIALGGLLLASEYVYSGSMPKDLFLPILAGITISCIILFAYVARKSEQLKIEEEDYYDEGADLDLEGKRTCRGFGYYEFTDYYGAKCSLQKSSLATSDAIWFGCDDADPKYLVPGQGWKNVEMPAEYVAHTRMHLTRKQVNELLPALQYFAKTGELPPIEEPTDG